MAPSSSDVGFLCMFLILSMFCNFCVRTEPTEQSKRLARGWGDHIHWQTFSHGLELAHKLDKPVMLIIHKTWCAACKKLKAKFAASKEIGKLSRNFIMVHTEDDEEPKDEKYAPDGSYIPRILFVDGWEHVREKHHNVYGNAKYRFFYSSADEVVASMKTVMDVWHHRNDDQRDADGGQVYDEL